MTLNDHSHKPSNAFQSASSASRFMPLHPNRRARRRRCIEALRLLLSPQRVTHDSFRGTPTRSKARNANGSVPFPQIGCVPPCDSFAANPGSKNNQNSNCAKAMRYDRSMFEQAEPTEARFCRRMVELAKRGGAATKRRAAADRNYYANIGRLGGRASIEARKQSLDHLSDALNRAKKQRIILFNP
jgi:general stress protein YciG